MIGNDPNAEVAVCPYCGCSSEDGDWDGDAWTCPDCGRQWREDQLTTSRARSAEGRAY